MKKHTFTVGVFDSGIGGLTLLHECAKQVPEAKFLFYGDNGRAPYGTRTEDEILAFTRQAMNVFCRKKVDAAVLACNTATAVAVNVLRKEYAFPIVGTEPAVKPAAAPGKKLLLLATPATCKSLRLRVLTGRFPECSIRLFPCAQLARAIEKNRTEGEPFLLSAHLPSGSYDGVILGCTHYIYVEKEIGAYYRAPVFHGNIGTAKQLKRVLERLKSGTDNHQQPPTNPNRCLRKKQRKGGKTCIKFIGKYRKMNKMIYFQTFVSEKTEKIK